MSCSRPIIKNLLLLATGSLLGVLITLLYSQRQLRRSSDDVFLYWQHAAMTREVEAYLGLVEASDLAERDKLRKLHSRAKAICSAYVLEVQNLTSKGYSWSPIDRVLYERARIWTTRRPMFFDTNAVQTWRPEDLDPNRPPRARTNHPAPPGSSPANRYE